MTTRTFDRREKHALIVDAAARVFVAQGFTNTRIADIAERAGVGKGTVYEYFSSKEELFFAVFEWMNDRIRSRVEETIEAHDSARERLLALMRLGARILAEQRDQYPMMNLEFWVTARGTDSEELFTRTADEQFRDYRELASDIIRRGQQRGEFRLDVDPEGLATVIVGAFDGLGMQCSLDARIDPERCIEELVAPLLRGLEPEDR